MQVLKKVDADQAREQLYALDRNQKPISETKRFAILTLGLFTMVATSFGSYTYNLVSGDLQEMYGLSQRDSTIITTCGSVVGNAVFPYAMIYDFFGALPISIISIVVFPLGALLTALCFQGVIAGTVVKLCVFYSFMNVGTTFYDISVVSTVLSHFPTRRGYVAALMFCFVGLGSSLTSSMKEGFFPDRSSFFYFLMVYAFICAILCCLFMHSPKYIITGFQERRLSEEEKEKRRATKAVYLSQEPQMTRFYVGISIVLFLIVYTVTTAALVSYLNLSHKYQLAFAVVTVVAWGSFLVLLLPIYNCGRKQQHNFEEEQYAIGENGEHLNDSEEDKKEEEVVFARPYTADGSIGDGVNVPQDVYQENTSTEEKNGAEPVIETEIDFIAPQYQTSFWRNLLSPDIWCLFWTIFAIAGTESMIMNNSSYIFAALSGEPVSDSLRALLSVLNGAGSAFGRLLMSWFEIYSQKQTVAKRIPLTICLFFSSTLVLITLVLLLSLPKGVLPLPYATSAIGNGFISCCTALVPRTIFGKDNAKHYYFLFLPSACSAIAINRFLYGEWYTVHADGVLVCLQRKCVQTPLIVCLALCATAFASNILVHLRYRAFCISVVKERQQLREQMAEGTELKEDKEGNQHEGSSEIATDDEATQYKKDLEPAAEDRDTNSETSSHHGYGVHI